MKKIFNLFLLFLIVLIHAQTISHEDIWDSRKFFPKYIDDIHSMKTGTHYTSLTPEGITKYSYTDKNDKTILFAKQCDTYSFSPDEQYVLIAQNTQPIYRHSYTGNYSIYNLKTKQETPLFNGKNIQEPLFSPTNDRIAFVYENNIYIQELATNKIIAVTKTGEKNKIINGINDWVYEEEFGFVRNFTWNSTGNELAFITLDETAVPIMNLSYYSTENYPLDFSYKYPKAGEKNATATAYSYNLNTKKLQDIKLSPYSDDSYIPKISYSPELTQANDLYIISSNRHQNELNIHKIDTKTFSQKILFTETDKAWIETDNITFELLPQNIIWRSERDGFSHLYLIDNQTGKLIKQLTKGSYEITKFYGYHNDNIYYQSTEEGSINRSIYKQDIITNKKIKLNTAVGNNEANFSANYHYFINTHSDANTPPKFTLNQTETQQEIAVLEDNINLINELKNSNISRKEFTEIKLDNNVQANMWMIKPQHFDKNKKYPVLMYVYGGPNSQTVENNWGYNNYLWFQQLAQLGYIVVSVDGRGTGAKGADFKKIIYKNLGKYELEDQLAAARYLKTLPYVDSNRLGIFGWSFGGYMTSLVMTKGNGLFKTGIAVAPVTNWRYYDSIYTERFLQTPQENPTGYEENSPLNFAQDLKGNYLIISGTADDNVHLQNTLQMSEKLTQAAKAFNMQLYMDKDHHIYGGKTRLHLYKMMTNYLLEKL